jgi:hypothetical protein
MSKEKNTENILIKSLTSPAKTFFTDIAEIGLDEILEKICEETKVLQEIPIIKWLFLSNDVHTIIQNAWFIKKYASFIGQIDLSFLKSPEDLNKLKELFNCNKKLAKVIDQTIISLDRYQTEFKTRILGELFVQTFIFNNFTIDEYNKLLFSIEYIHPYDGFDKLKLFYTKKKEYDSANEKEIKNKIWLDISNIDYSSLVNTGLLNLPTGGSFTGDLGGAWINDLGKRFYEKVVTKTVK